MKQHRKKQIDNLWMNTKYGQWVLLMASGKTDEADAVADTLINEHPYTLNAHESAIAKVIAEKIKKNEFEEYLKELDHENYELVEFMIAHDIFGSLY